MTLRKIYTLIEDEAHRNFLSLCSNIVLELNRECSTGFELSPSCHGIYELVVNKLPSFLAFTARHYLLVLDLDDNNELSLVDWIVDCIKHAKTSNFHIQ